MKSIPNRPLTHRLPVLAGPFAEPLTATILLPSVSISIAQPVPQKQHTLSVFLRSALGCRPVSVRFFDRACWAHADTLAAIVALGVTEVRRCRLRALDSPRRRRCRRFGAARRCKHARNHDIECTFRD